MRQASILYIVWSKHHKRISLNIGKAGFTQHIQQRWSSYGGRGCDLLGWVVVWCTDTEAEDFLHWLIRVYGFVPAHSPDSCWRRCEHYFLKTGFIPAGRPWDCTFSTLVQLLIFVRDLFPIEELSLECKQSVATANDLPQLLQKRCTRCVEMRVCR